MYDEDDEDAPSLSNRLMSRSDGVRKIRLPDGGEAMTGPTVRQALKAIGARAMTMDETVFVDEGFDVNNAEDMALYFHEQHHQQNSGGHHNGSGNTDAEERSARAIERMVLHRANAGDSFDNIAKDLKNGNGPSNQAEAEKMVANAVGGSASEGDGPEDPMNAYNAMLAQGKTHNQIVRELVEHCINEIERQRTEHIARSTEPADF